jgi:hypothetical protein
MRLGAPPPFILIPRTRKARQAYYRRKSREDARVELALAKAQADRAMWEMQATDAKLTHERIVKRDEQVERERVAQEKRASRRDHITQQMLDILCPEDAVDDVDELDEEDLADLPADDDAAAQ